MNQTVKTLELRVGAMDLPTQPATAIEENRAMMIGDPPTQIQAMTLITGIPKLDEALATGPGDGGVIVVCGPTGGGKTVLAVQMAVNSALAGRNVWALMTEDPYPRNFHERAYSAVCDEPYERLQRGLKFMDIGTGAIRLPVLQGTGMEFSHKAFNLGQVLRTRLRLGFNPNLHDDPLHGIRDFIDDVTDGDTAMPDILIIDYFYANFNRDAGQEEQQDLIHRTMKYLRRLATDHGVLVVVCCQASSRVTSTCKNVWKDQVAEFPQIVGQADRFVGITRLASISTDCNQGFATNQFLTVFPDVQEDGYISIPVHADFDFQRFLPRDENPGARRMPHEEYDENQRARLADQGRRIRLRSNHRGWVKFDRHWLLELAELHHPASVNVFVLLLLMADHRTGECFPGRNEIVKETGLSIKEVRVAIKKLEAGGFIKNTGRKCCRAIVWRVTPPASNDRPKDRDFWFCLHRNLRDDSRIDLFTEPALLRVWLLCLASARYKFEPDMEVPRGSFLIEPKRLADRLGITESELEEGLAKLEMQRRITLAPSSIYPEIKVASIVNWELYQGGWIEGRPSQGSDEQEED